MYRTLDEEKIAEMSVENLIYVLENWDLDIGQGNRIVREILKRIHKTVVKLEKGNETK
jgi:hypothetical protein